MTVGGVVRRPLAEVFDFVADMRNDPQWAPLVRDVEQVHGDGPGVGARWRFQQRLGKRWHTMEMEMVAYQRPALLSWAMQRRSVDYRSTIAFAPHRQGTALRQTTVQELRGAWWLPLVARPLIRRTLRRQMRLLRRALEGA